MLSANVFVAVEDCIIARVKELLGSKVRAVESLPGDWDADTLKRILRLMPGVFPNFAGGAPRAIGGTSAEFAASWILYVGTAHASGEAARRRGDSQQAGAYELMACLIPGLHNYVIKGHGTLQFAQVENLFSGQIEKQGCALYALTFAMTMTLPAEAPSLEAFETFHAQYDIPPHETAAEHQKWLAGDHTTSKPEAEDNVEPEQ